MQHGTPKLKKGSIRMLNPTLPQSGAAASPPASDLGLVVDDGEAGSVQ